MKARLSCIRSLGRTEKGQRQPRTEQNGTDRVTMGKEKARRSGNSVEPEGMCAHYSFLIIAVFWKKAIP